MYTQINKVNIWPKALIFKSCLLQPFVANNQTQYIQGFSFRHLFSKHICRPCIQLVSVRVNNPGSP